ncbi:MAG: PAS domain S-box protein [Nitrospirota bacterium]
MKQSISAQKPKSIPKTKPKSKAKSLLNPKIQPGPKAEKRPKIGITKRIQSKDQSRQVSQNQSTFRELVEHAPFGIYIVDSRFRIIQMNEASQNGAFRNVRPVIGRNFSEAMHVLWPEPIAAEIVAVFRHTLETGEPYYSSPFTKPRHDISTIESYEWELHRITLPDGLYGVVCYYFDSTNLLKSKKALQDSEERLSLAASGTQIGMYDWDVVTGEILWTEQVNRLLGLKATTNNNNTFQKYHYQDWTDRVNPEDLKRIQAELRCRMDEKLPYESEYRVIWPDGSVHWHAVRGIFHYDADGRCTRMLGILMDITEKKLIEQTIRNNEERLKMALYAGHVFAFEWNPATDKVIRSKSCEEILGLRGKVALNETGKAFFRRVHPEDRGKFIEKINSLNPKNNIYSYKYRLIRPDGEMIVLEETAKGHFDEKGQMINIHGMTADVTEREKFEKALLETNKHLLELTENLEKEVEQRTETIREQAEILDSLFKYTITPLVLLDRDFNFIRVNQAYADICSMDMHEFIGHNHFEFFPHEENEAIFRNVVKTKKPYQIFAKPFVFPDHPEWGVTYWTWTLTPLLDPDGQVSYLIFALNDVTARIKAQEKVKIERNRLKTIFDTMPDGLLIVSKEHDIQYINPALENDFGPVNSRKCFEYFHNLTEACSWCRNTEVLAGSTVHDEWTYHKTGRIYELLSTPFINDDGSTSKMQIFHDITIRKQAEEKLQRSESRLREAQRIARVGNWEWDIKSNQSIWSDEMFRILGLPPEAFEPSYNALLGFVHPDDREYLENTIKDSYYTKTPYAIDHRIIIKDGSEKIVHEMGEILFDQNNVPLRLSGTIQDVTELKRIEQQLRLSEERIRNLYKHFQVAREKEQEIIAQEIHDVFGTMLTSLNIDISMIEKHIPKEDQELIDRLRKDQKLLSDAIKTVHRISSELRPRILDYLGLPAAIDWYVKDFSARTKIKYHLDIDVKTTDIHREQMISLYRILQESMTNIARHAEASAVTVSLTGIIYLTNPFLF